MMSNFGPGAPRSPRSPGRCRSTAPPAGRPPCPFDVRPVVVEEHRPGRLDLQAGADEGVGSGVGLAQPALVGVDELVDQVLEAVGGLLALPGADEAVAEDPGPVARAQQAGVLDQLGVGRPEVVAPQVGHELRELPLVEAEALSRRLVHLGLADGADLAAAPGVGHALADLARGEAEPGFPGGAQPRSGVISRMPPMSNTTAWIVMSTIIRLAPGARATRPPERSSLPR